MFVENLLAEKDGQIWSITPDATVYEALVLMDQKDIGALLVMQGNKLIGILSERDYARKIIIKGKSSKETLVKEVMTTEVCYVDKKKRMDECLAIMSDKRIRHLPVMENNQLIGLVSIGDVVKSIISEQEIVIDDLYNYINGVYYSPH
ncbi:MULTISPECIES: CBS domain-containing protein [Sedimenticola]|uniref:CBS domain-containing protein n=1 Tax=Sedimenticola selenatireducens TaxID=191960 RepID=A0A2N6CSA3_9GAMM|nr:MULTISPECIES: CBS domain-containing protein [Sedimenticola]MCW8902921.1 CBS domain-containing protein [Sedimenticola sp.]PLX59961.1 MAG: CBS domain-containing protein [Sedimenticola selenatireducens]